MLRRLAPASAVVALLLAGATGCAASSSAALDCEPALSNGALSESVKVSGESGETPSISVSGDAQAGVSQRSFVTKAENRENLANDDHLVGVNVAYFDSETEELLQEEGDFAADGAGSYMLITEQTATPVTDAIKCAAPGDRIVIAVSGEESQAFGMNFPGYTPGASVIAVADIVTVSDLAASGPARGLPNGFPGVTTNEDGRPGVVLPPTEAPEGLVAATRIVGEGERVEAEDRLVLQLLIVDWEGNIVDNRWEGGPVIMGGETEMNEAGLKFRDKMTGQTVGSQQVIIDSTGEQPQVIVADILAAG